MRYDIKMMEIENIALYSIDKIHSVTTPYISNFILIVCFIDEVLGIK